MRIVYGFLWIVASGVFVRREPATTRCSIGTFFWYRNTRKPSYWYFGYFVVLHLRHMSREQNHSHGMSKLWCYFPIVMRYAFAKRLLNESTLQKLKHHYNSTWYCCANKRWKHKFGRSLFIWLVGRRMEKTNYHVIFLLRINIFIKKSARPCLNYYYSKKPSTTSRRAIARSCLGGCDHPTSSALSLGGGRTIHIRCLLLVFRFLRQALRPRGRKNVFIWGKKCVIGKSWALDTGHERMPCYLSSYDSGSAIVFVIG